MPASICDTVSSALRLSLTADETQNTASLDSRLYSSTKIAHLSKIEFEESGDYQSSVFDGLKSKYNVVIRPKKPALETKVLKKEGNPNTINSDNNKYEDGLPRPKRILFPLEKVHLGWQGMWTVGAGMQNVGNTCYLNSTLQALYHVPAFANWLISEGPHVEKCNQHEGCVICGMRATLHATQKSGGSPIKPWQVYSKLRLICRHLTPGRQEDAHEFLRYLVEAMEKSYLSRFISIEKLDQYSKETTPLNQILGGYLRSTVRCLSCQHLSTTYQHFQDLLLDIRKHSTLDEALDSFFSRERLEDLGYKCEACNKKVSATKQFFIERAPMVLCIALKRFSLTGGKLSKQIQFRKKICLNKYMHSRNNQTNLSYKLVSVVTHIGPSQNCGHYTAIGQAPNGHYYQFDDSSVKPLPLSGVLATHAYIMFFEKDNGAMENTLTSSASTSNIVYGPQLPDNFMIREKSPIKLPFCKSDERKSLINLSNVTTETSKSGVKPPVILNSTLSKSNASNSNSEPWVVNQNGDVEKVITTPKFANGTKNDEDDNKNNVIILKSLHCDDANAKHRQFRNETELRTSDKVISSVKIVRLAKSPLEKLEEQMNSNVQRNGSSKLVPYDTESSGDERPDRNKDDRLKRDQVAAVSKPSRCVSPRSMHHAWTVSSESEAPLLSPSLNGVTNTNKKVKEKEESHQEDSNKSPNTSVSTMSPLSERSASAPNSKAGSPVGATCAQPVPPLMSANLMGRHDTLRQLQHMSHRGYGAPVDSWPGHHSNMNRQVFEERREERKRAMEGYDEMDHGRLKKVKKFHNSYNGFRGRNGYNVFQDKQNKPVWNNGFIKYHGDRRHQPRNFKHHNKYNKRYNRYNSGHHYPRHR